MADQPWVLSGWLVSTKRFFHASSRFRAQRPKLFAGLHGGWDTLALDGAIVLPLEEWLRRLREQDQPRDVGRAGAPLEFLKDEVAYARTARPDFNDHGAQQSGGSEALQSAGADDPRALTGGFEETRSAVGKPSSSRRTRMLSASRAVAVRTNGVAISPQAACGEQQFGAQQGSS
jgi:hypothetical protein